MRAFPPLIFLFGLTALACTGGAEEATGPTSVAPPAPAPEPSAEALPADETPKAPLGRMDWPVYTSAHVPTGRTVTLPDGHALVDMAMAPKGDRAVVVTAQGRARNLWTWDFAGALAELALPEGGMAQIEDVAFSGFDHALFVLGGRDGGGAIERWEWSDGQLGAVHKVLAVPERLSHLVVPYVLFGGQERVFFARHPEAGGSHMMGIGRLGAGAYELANPAGVLSEWTVAEYRERTGKPGDWDVAIAPAVWAAEGAVPLSISAVHGGVLWQDADGAVQARRWGADNWGEGHAPPNTAGLHLQHNPLGSLEIGWHRDGRVGAYFGGQFLDGAVAEGAPVRSPPAVAWNGAAVLLHTDAGLETRAVDHPYANVRYAAQFHGGTLKGDLLSQGFASDLGKNHHTQLFTEYEQMSYLEAEGDDMPPVFVSIDGMLEVLHAGFEAVFMRAERDVAAPRLDAFAQALAAAATKDGHPRVAEIAQVSRQLLVGDHSHPEAALALAEEATHSDLHNKTVPFQDFKPRGPYAADAQAQGYFRAFKYMNQLVLDEEELEALRTHPEVLATWQEWTETQAAFLAGSRFRGLFDDDWDVPPWMRAHCREYPDRPPERRAFPLNWPIDSELLDRTTAHDRLPPECGVALRVLPNGLDLLSGLGSTHARSLQQDEYQQYPTLATAHRSLLGGWEGALPHAGIVPSWLRLIQILGNDQFVPVGVDQDLWRGRLLETALASWTSQRHTMVLLNEVGAAEMGGGSEGIFEELRTEPPRGAVDPVPLAWLQLAQTFGRLEAHSRTTDAPDRVSELLGAAAGQAQQFGDMADRQLRGEALSLEEYRLIQGYGRVIEHPFLLFKSAAASTEDRLRGPDPIMKIVDVYAWKDPQGEVKYWHPAVGRPQRVVVALHDRGTRVATRGAIYSYNEVVSAGAVLNDEDWREVVDRTAPLDWTNAARLTEPAP